ncbi:hypothetical protein L1987_78960 [Smallanthus sonchifolius]|uniref:Uncharacterized protein n=1 Tax=Smallanthus sonchifolius TaxID=185202 RepID=A0ACB8ZDB8_9ASTR|nr:hypothetical protein L1987_78960 [Smallanthus sonchifolius]
MVSWYIRAVHTDITIRVDDEDLGSHVEHITTIGTSNEWTNFRHGLATSMFNTNTFNRVFGTESNREELRNNLFAEMNKVEGLTTRECDKAVCKLAHNEELMVIFYKVDKERKLG